MLGRAKLAPSLIAFALGLVLAAGAQAQEPRKAYRHVDASGQVTYSQSPPVDGKDAKKVEKVDISPAQRGRGGYADGGYSIYDDPRYYSGQGSQGYYNAHAAAAARQQAHEQQMAEVRAECLRQRGADCNNPAALRYLESTSQPRHGTVVRRPATPYSAR